MDSGRLWLIAMVLSIAAAVLVMANVTLATMVQAEAQAVNQRRTAITQAQQITRIINLAAEGLARAAVRDNDEEIKALLARSGINLTPQPPTPTPVIAPALTPATPDLPKP